MRIIALPGEKGGSGRTTTTVDLDGAQVEKGRRLLLLDTAPQAASLRSVGIVVSNLACSIHTPLSGQTTLTGLIVRSPTYDLFVVLVHHQPTANGVEITVPPSTGLRKAPSILSPNVRDNILVDCPPRLDVLLIKAVIMVSDDPDPRILRIVPCDHPQTHSYRLGNPSRVATVGQHANLRRDSRCQGSSSMLRASKDEEGEHNR